MARRWTSGVPWWAVAAVLGIVATALALSTLISAQLVRERAFDTLLTLTAPRTGGDAVVVVDIDRELIERFGPWPWGRDRLAQLVAAIADGKPKALGLDILLIGPDERSAGALARQLAQAAGEPRVRELATSLAGELPNADRQLAEALRRVPTVLGFALDSEAEDELAGGVPIPVQGRPNVDQFWIERRAIGPPPVLAAAGAGLGVLSLPGDPDARIRRVPLLVLTERGLRPGFALEVVRVVRGAGSHLFMASGPMLRTGSGEVKLAFDGMLRLRPVGGARHLARVEKASRIVADADARAGLAGRVVLVGSSEPGVGGLRPSAVGELVPSVQVQADAVEQLMAADAPRRTGPAWWLELLAALATTAAAVGMGLQGRPQRTLPLVAGLVGAWLALVVGVLRFAGVLVDPLLVPGALVTGYLLAAATAAARTRRREALIRRRFEQHLAPAVVARIVAQPGLIKLEGETREITALFTDIEGFTSLTERAGPADLIRLLDRYIEGASRIVVEHGGMVEKIVGDGLHAIFNAPLDLADHPTRALDCAIALDHFAERMRQEPDALRLGFGRTRIGIETGLVIVGDVGGGRRLDYTAHGDAMNRAARLEAANKELGSVICIGPRAAGMIAAGRLVPLGGIALRGVTERLEVFQPVEMQSRRAR